MRRSYHYFDHFFAAVVSLALVAGACKKQVPCADDTLTIDAEGFHMTGACGNATLSLRPRALVDGAWRGGGDDGACRVDPGATALRCPAGPAGEVTAAAQPDGSLLVSFSASRPVVVEALALEGEVILPGATSWLSNGFQSWSQSGVIALGPPPSDAALQSALSAIGDQEVLRSGVELSWWHSFAGGAEATLLAGALDATQLKPWVQIHRGPGLDELIVRVAAGGTGERIALAAGETLAGDPWRIELGTDLAPMLRAFGEALPTRRSTHPVPPEAGWNSWYELWDTVDATTMRANAGLAQGILERRVDPGVGPLRIVVDDGWQIAWGEWSPNAKFPSGLDGLANDLRAEGLVTGVWLAPLLVHEASRLIVDHPDWFLPNLEYAHLKNGPMRILDVTHPDAEAHLTREIARVVSWGYDLLKIDFLFAGSWEDQRYAPATGIAAYRRALAAIRAGAGEDTILLAVGAPALPSLPYIDAWRVGGDIALENTGTSWFYLVNQARMIAARWPVCLATLCDPDPVILREMTRDEVEFGAWVVALAGGGLFLSDDLTVLPSERMAWGLDDPVPGLSLGGFPGVPVRHFPPDPPAALGSPLFDILNQENSHVIPRIWLLSDGSRVALNPTDDVVNVDDVAVPARSARHLP